MIREWTLREPAGAAEANSVGGSASLLSADVGVTPTEFTSAAAADSRVRSMNDLD